MLGWLERNINSSYSSFIGHVFVGARHLKGTSLFPFMFMTVLGTMLGMYIMEEAALAGFSVWQAMTMGFPIGFIAVSLLFWVVALCYILFVFPFPSCQQGKCCKMDDYKWSIGTIYGWEAWGIHHYWCSCGDEYVRHGRRFMRVSWNNDDWALVRYKKLVGFRKWADDSD